MQLTHCQAYLYIFIPFNSLCILQDLPTILNILLGSPCNNIQNVKEERPSC